MSAECGISRYKALPVRHYTSLITEGGLETLALSYTFWKWNVQLCMEYVYIYYVQLLPFSVHLQAPLVGMNPVQIRSTAELYPSTKTASQKENNSGLNLFISVSTCSYQLAPAYFS